LFFTLVKFVMRKLINDVSKLGTRRYILYNPKTFKTTTCCMSFKDDVEATPGLDNKS
jgi:hypothetical protein